MELNSNYRLLIQKLDQFIRKFYLNKLLKGSLYFVGLILATYLIISLTEYKLYFSTNIRKLIAFGFVSLFSISGFVWIVKPLIALFRLGKTISHEQAAAIIGTHFTDIKDKLLNALQLKQKSEEDNSGLLEASINQKIDNIKLVPFSNAIDLSKNKKYLKYALPPIGALLFLLVAAPSILKESNLRLSNPNTVFAKKAPFEFYLQNKKLKISQFENLPIELKVDGSVLPKDVFIQLNGKSIKMEKKSANSFAYVFSNVQENFKFNFNASGFNSIEHNVKVLPKALITGLNAIITYPAYTGKQKEQIENTSDLYLPEGTLVDWQLKTENTEQLKFRVGNIMLKANQIKKNRFSFSQKFLKNTSCSIHYSNADEESIDSVAFNVSVLEDKAPLIMVDKITDSTNLDYNYFVGNASDDYGFSRLEFHYQILDEKGKLKVNKLIRIPVGKAPILDFDQVFDASNINLLPGDKIQYFFDVWDNDAIHGPKMARSSIYSYQKSSKQDLKEKEENNNEEIKDNLSEAKKDMDDFSKKMEEMRKKILTKKSMTWEDKKELEDLLKAHKELEKSLQEMKNDFSENLKNQDQFKKVEPELLEKQEKLEKMMEEILSDEVKDLLKKIEDLMSQIQKKDAFEKLDEFKMSSQDLKMELDKLESLFKKLEFEAKVNETVNKLEELAKKQEELNKETKEGNKPIEELKKEQEQLNKEFDKIKEDLKNLEEKNKEQGNPLDTEKNEEKAEEIQDKMEQSKESLEKNDPSKAGKNQKSAAEKMKEMASDMKGQMEAKEAKDGAEDMETIRQLLENLVKYSFEQESLMKELKTTQSQSPKYLKIMESQQNLKDDLEMISDSLVELGKRQFEIASFVNDELHKINREMVKTMKGLEDRNVPAATNAQQFLMTSANNLALMLDESLQKMQQQMAQSKPGSGSCNKPGGKGMKESQSMQKQLNEQLKKMQQEMKEGGKTPKQMGKGFAEAAQKQAEIREALRKLKEGMSQDEKNKSGIDKLMKEMDKTEEDLANRRLTQEMFERQQEILTKMLEFDDADRQQDQKDDRKSNSSPEINKKMPPAIEEYLKNKKSDIELYKALPPDLKPFYKNLVEKYYQSLN
ncbi:MAG: DUF4175 domain-containing protein [Bacteroidetes bacterium]|nr:DUF4175 domain-containing protein [Bacteroidota bacterium]MBK8673621.1 DUF4175 domain-containing protein [Bacteroidota bacterium]